MTEAAGADEQRKALEKKYRALQIEQQKRAMARKVMTVGAYERLMNVRVSNYELYGQLIDLIISLAQSNKLRSLLTEEQLKDILGRITYRPESKIEFKRK